MSKAAANEDKERYERIFKKLDRNHNGKIDINDLRDELGVSEKYAQVSCVSFF
jgi:Ca2+-binding EF-hand superfamily protein